jgi:hypothetical protein
LAGEGAGGASVGMDTAAIWAKKLLEFMLLCEVMWGRSWGLFDSRNHVLTCAKRVCGLASDEEVRRESSLLCHFDTL